MKLHLVTSCNDNGPDHNWCKFFIIREGEGICAWNDRTIVSDDHQVYSAAPIQPPDDICPLGESQMFVRSPPEPEE